MIERRFGLAHRTFYPARCRRLQSLGDAHPSMVSDKAHQVSTIQRSIFPPTYSSLASFISILFAPIGMPKNQRVCMYTHRSE
jgi:hypothetical protein